LSFFVAKIKDEVLVFIPIWVIYNKYERAIPYGTALSLKPKFETAS